MTPRADNVQSHWGASESSFLSSGEVEHVAGLRRMGFDPLAQPAFWEAVVARQFGGTMTSHSSEHDIEVEIGGFLRFIEVKYSTGHRCTYSPIRGRDSSREQFRWAKPRGMGGKDEVDAIVLIGRALSGLVYSWVLPRDAVARRCSSIAVTCPEERTTDGWRWDRYAVPFGQILPAVARICRGVLPGTALPPRVREQRRIRDKAAQLLFEMECSR